MFLPIRPGPGQTDPINRLIQLTVIQLSGGHCILNVIFENLFLEGCDLEDSSLAHGICK